MTTVIFEPLSLYDTGPLIRSHDHRNRHYDNLSFGTTKNCAGFRCDAHGPLTEHLMHIAHKIRNTSWISKSHWIGWNIQDLWETFVSRSFCQTPSWKKKAVVFATVMMSAYQDRLNAGFSKVCEICKVNDIDGRKQNVIGCFTYQLYGLASTWWDYSHQTPLKEVSYALFDQKYSKNNHILK